MQRKLNLYATQRLIELFSNIEHQIAYTFNESIRYRNSFPVSYLDFGSTNDTISFIARNKYDDIQKNHQADWNSRVWKEKRSEMKIGKLVKMFYQDHFPVNHPKDRPRPKPMVDIESFVNKFKAERDKDVNYDRFEIISGKDFHFWYTQDNYSRFVHEETTLGRSCLRYNESSKFLNMYSKNPDTFRMLILKDDAGKLRGRANLWNLEKPEGRIYMDRVYSVNDFDVELFKDYAKQEGWLHKEAQTYGWHNNIVDTSNGEIYKWDDMVMLARIQKAPGTIYKYYPYLDTLSIFNPDEKTLTNDGRLRVLNPHIMLTDYQGSYHSEVDGHERVFSSSYNEYIRRDESVFVEIDDTWVYESDAVYVHNSGGQHAYRNSDKIVESYIYKRKYFLKEATEYSEYLGTYIHKESMRIAFLDSDKTEEVKIHYRMIGKDFEEKDGVILKKKISPKQRSSSKRSLEDKKSLEHIEHLLGRISGGSSSSGRSGRTRLDGTSLDWSNHADWYNPYPAEALSDPDPISEETISEADNQSGEEDSDLLSGIDTRGYTDEMREEMIRLLEEERWRRVENERRRNEEIERMGGQIGTNILGEPGRSRPLRMVDVQDRGPNITQTRPVRRRHPIEDRPQVTEERVEDDMDDVVNEGTTTTPHQMSFDVEVSPEGRYFIRSNRQDETREEIVDEPNETEERPVEENTSNDQNDSTGGVSYRTDRWLEWDNPHTDQLRFRPSTTNRWNTNSIDMEMIRQMYLSTGIPSSLLGRDNEEDTPNGDDE